MAEKKSTIMEKKKGLSAEQMDSFLLDYIDMMRGTLDSYADIAEKLATFQENNEDIYDVILELFKDPGKIIDMTNQIKEIDKDIFYRLLELMFIYSTLDSKVRRMYSLSAEEKRTLSEEIRKVTGEVEALFEDVKKIASKKGKK